MTTYSNISEGESSTDYENLDSCQNEPDHTFSLKDRRSSVKDDPDEPSFASQIKPRYQKEDQLEGNESNDDNATEEFQDRTNQLMVENLDVNTSRYKISRTECILIFLICCICLSYTCGVYVAVLVDKASQPKYPEFRLVPDVEFTAKMMTKKLHIPFYVKKKYQPKGKEELEMLWTLVEDDWQFKKKFDF